MQRGLARFLRLEGIPILLALALAGAVFGILNPAFLSAENLSAIVVQSMFILVIAVGMSFVLTAGVIDLSVGSVLGLSGGVTMFMFTMGFGTVPAITAGLAVGLGFGLVNGLLVTVLRLSDFIVTLATMGVGAGLLQILAYYRPLRGGETPAFSWLAYGTVLGIPFPIVLGVGLVVALAFVMQRSAFGRSVRAAGMSPAAATFAGIDVDRLRLAVFVMSGVLASVSGVLLAARLASVQPALGRGYELQAIAAAVLGGTALSGGRGSVVGAAIGALLLAAIAAGLQIAGVDPTWYQVVVGIAILLAVAFHGWAGGFVERHLASVERPAAEADPASQINQGA
ncbi:MAG: ribose ABC transporter permease [Rhodobacter sp. CACIA14H1]|nr:MAG: ribose ABC transporter permease [Rhodobacter sp. CACIA14H1]